MRIGIPLEVAPGENRVAATPRTVTQLIGLGYDVLVESGAGARAALPDAAFRESGAEIKVNDGIATKSLFTQAGAATQPVLAFLGIDEH